MRLEEIQISAIDPDFIEEAPSAAREIECTLEQRARFRFCKYTFRIVDGRFLSINVNGMFKHHRDYEFNIGILDPEPKRQVSVNWGYIAAFLILAMSATLTVYAGLFRNSSMVSSLLAANAFVFLVLAAYSCRNRLVFFSKNGWVPLAIFFYRKPYEQGFHAFTDTLTAHIRDVQSGFTSRREMLSEELKEHRNLMERGIISSEEYGWIRQHILGLHNSETQAQLPEAHIDGIYNSDMRKQPERHAHRRGPVTLKRESFT
jgi:hypothetical protein